MTMSESLEDRMIRERTERKVAADKAVEMREAQREASRNFTNPTRREEAQRVYRELWSPAEIASKPKVAQSAPPVAGKSVLFYAYKDGVIGTMEILVSKDFTPS